MTQKSEIKIQLLKPTDQPLFFDMLALFGEVFEDSRTYCDNQPSPEYVSNILAKKSFISLVAISDDSVIGGLTAYVLEKYEQERSEIYIYDLAVSDKFRRKKVATNLISTLCKEARNLDAYVVFVQADFGDDPAIALYESLGKKEDILHFDINPKFDVNEK